MLRIRVIPFHLLLIFLPLSAAPAESPAYRFQTYSVEQGMSSAEIYTVLQDRTGFLWIGTTNGLHRFDGYSFTVFRNVPFDSTSLSANFIFHLCEGREGDLWVAAAGQGVCRFDAVTGRVKRLAAVAADTTRISSDEGTRIYADRNGTVWYGTLSGTVDRIDEWSGAVRRLSYGETGNAAVRGFAEEEQGSMFILTARRLLSVSRDGTVSSVPGLPPAAAENGYSAMLRDASGRLWIGAAGRLWMRERGGEAFRPVPFLHGHRADGVTFIGDITAERPGVLWIATNDGVFRYDESTRTTLDLRSLPGYPKEFIRISSRTVTIDRTGVVWIGYGVYGMVSVHPLNAGITTLREHPDPRRGLPHRYIRGLAEDSAGRLWIGTFGGLVRYDPADGAFRRYPALLKDASGRPIQHMNALAYRDGVLWIGTGTDGLYTMDLQTGRPVHRLGAGSAAGGPADNTIHDITFDRFGRAWVGTREGGVAVLTGDGRFLKRYAMGTGPAPLPHNNVRSVLHDRLGNIWIGTFGGAVMLHPDERTFTLYTTVENDPRTLSNARVLALLEDRRGTVWIATSGDLNRFDRESGTFRQYGVWNGFINDIIVGLAEDRRGDLWVSTYGGLATIDSTGAVRQTLFGADGLQNDLFNTGATLALRSGSVAFGGAYGLSIVDPAAVQSGTAVPPVVVQAFLRSDVPSARAVSSGEPAHIVLEPGDPFVRFEFAVMDFRFPRGNAYAYRLEGLEPDWTVTTARRNVTYANLAEGSYRFQVRSAGRDGVWNERAASVQLTVIPPLMQRWWFRPLVLLLVIAAAAGITVLRVRHRLALERLRTSIAADLHDEIGSVLARIANLADIMTMTGKKAPARGVRRRTPAADPRTIAELSRGLMEKMSDVVWSVDPRNDDLDRLASRLREHLFELGDAHGLTVTWEVEGRTAGRSVDPKTSRATLLIVKEAAANVLRHASASAVVVRLVVTDRRISFSLRDDGRGFDERALGRVNGLYNMRQRAASCGGTCEVRSAPGKGTEVSLLLPL